MLCYHCVRKVQQVAKIQNFNETKKVNSKPDKQNIYPVRQNFQPKRKWNQWQVSLFFIILTYSTSCPGLHYFVGNFWCSEPCRAAIMLLSPLMARKVCYDQTLSVAYRSYLSGEC